METTSYSYYNLQRLQKWLDYEVSGSTLLLFSWFYPIIMSIALLAAIIFIPLMVKILFEEKKFGWLIYFFFIVVLPAIIVYASDFTAIYKSMLGLIPLAGMFFYFFNLKLAVRRWIVDYKFIRGDTEFIKDADEVFRNSRF